MIIFFYLKVSITNYTFLDFYLVYFVNGCKTILKVLNLSIM